MTRFTSTGGGKRFHCGLVASLGLALIAGLTGRAGPDAKSGQPAAVRPRKAPQTPGRTARTGSSPLPARLLAVTSGTSIRRNGDPVGGLKAGTRLQSGDVLATGPRGNTDLALGNQGVLRLKPSSTVRLNAIGQPPKPGAPRETRLDLSTGTVLTRLRRLAGKERFLITTPSAVTAAHGTTFLVSATAKETRVVTGEGAVSVSEKGPTGRELVVGAAQRAVVTSDGTVQPPADTPAPEAGEVFEVWRVPNGPPEKAALVWGIVRVVNVWLPGNNEPVMARLGMVLPPGTRVRTGGRSKAILLLNSASRVTLDENTELVVSGAGPQVRNGKITADHYGPGTITGGYATAAVRG
jgi:hypothetical protein